MFKCRELYCAILMENKHKGSGEFFFYIKRGVKYSNHWDLKGFTNIYITCDLILLVSIYVRAYLFSVLVKFVRPCRACNKTLFG